LNIFAILRSIPILVFTKKKKKYKQKKQAPQPKKKKNMARKLQAADINLRNLFCANKKTTQKQKEIKHNNSGCSLNLSRFYNNSFSAWEYAIKMCFLQSGKNTPLLLLLFLVGNGYSDILLCLFFSILTNVNQYFYAQCMYMKGYKPGF